MEWQEEFVRNWRPVPTNLITGFLGVGKTTAIRHLLAHRPGSERWAVLVNEFGEVGVDGAALEAGEAVAIRELPGGCLCCTMGAPLRVTLTRLIREQRPDRLLIEPTGLGHPARVLDTLRADGLGQALDVQASVCLVDPRQLDDERVRGHPVFRDQVELADVLVANKSDLAAPAVIAGFDDWAAGLFPAKARVARVERGELDPRWLELGPDPGRRALFPDLHDHAAEQPPREIPRSPAPGQPVRLPSRGLGQAACGWVFDPADSFDRSALMAVLAGFPGVERLKGVFHCGRDWLLVNRVAAELAQEPSGWRRDSRLELILRPGAETDWPGVEQSLLSCLADHRGPLHQPVPGGS